MAYTLQDLTISDAQPSHAQSTPAAVARPHTPPNLLGWDNNLPSSSSSPLTSAFSSPVLSPESQAFADDVYSPHSKSRWQLAQSEPAISTERGEEGGSRKEERRTTAVVDGSPELEKTRVKGSLQRDTTVRARGTPRGGDTNVKRRSVLHFIIPMKYIGHTRDIGDEDPVLPLAEGDGASENEEMDVLCVVDEQGRGRRRRSRSRGFLRDSPRLGGSLPPSSSSMSTNVALTNAAHYTEAVPPSQCPFDPQPPLSSWSSPTAAALPLSAPPSPLAPASLPTPQPPTRSLSAPGLAPRSPFPSQPTPVLPKRMYISSQESLDSLGLPPCSLVRSMDLAQYTRSSRAGEGWPGRSQAGSVASVDSKGTGAGGGRHSRRGSASSGKFVVMNIPPFKAVRRGSDASSVAVVVVERIEKAEAIQRKSGLDAAAVVPVAQSMPESAAVVPVIRNESTLVPKKEPVKPVEEKPIEVVPVFENKPQPQAPPEKSPSTPDQEMPQTSPPTQPMRIMKRQAVVLDDILPSSRLAFMPQKESPNTTEEAELTAKKKLIMKRKSDLIDDILSTPSVPAQPSSSTTTTSSIRPPVEIYDAEGNRILGGYPTGERIQLYNPPLSPEEIKYPPISTRSERMVRLGKPGGPGGGLFNNAVSGIAGEKKKGKKRNGKEEEKEEKLVATMLQTARKSPNPGLVATVSALRDTGSEEKRDIPSVPAVAHPAEPQKEKEPMKAVKMGNTGAMFTKNKGVFGKPMFSLPMSSGGPLVSQNSIPYISNTHSIVEGKDTRRNSQSSRSSNPPAPSITSSNDPVSPTQTSYTGDSDSTNHPQPTVFNQPSFTNPVRPLFSGYEQVTPAATGGLPVSENLRRGAEEWLRRQREKDLRQALRLEKALDEKRSGLIKRLEWKAPLVETQKGYGYGDGLEPQQETKLATGEVLKVLTFEERLAMEEEVKKVEDSLVMVREDILKNGGEPGQAISYFGGAFGKARERAKAVDERAEKERVAFSNAFAEKHAEKLVIEKKEAVETQPSRAQETGTIKSSLPNEVASRNTTPEEAEKLTSEDQGKEREVFSPTKILPTPQNPKHIIRKERQRVIFDNLGDVADDRPAVDRNGKICFIAAYAAKASPEGLERFAQRASKPPIMPDLPILRMQSPDHLKSPSPQSRNSLENAGFKRKEKTLRIPTTQVVKRTVVTLDDGAWAIDPVVEGRNEPRPAPTRNGLLDLLTGTAIFGGKPAQLTEQSMKRHEQMMTEDEKRGVKVVLPSDNWVESSALPLKVEPPKTAPVATSPPATKPAPAEQASQESGRSMWVRWGDSPLPGTSGTSDGPGSPPFHFLKPRPASSVPPPEAIARPSSVAPAAAQLIGPGDALAAKQERRASMSTAKSGEEASVQMAQGLGFNKSDDDNDETGDDSRDYVSAEEGEDSHSAEGEDFRQLSEAIYAPDSDVPSRPTLQRKRSLATTGLPMTAPVPENKHRPSPLDDWNFGFASRKLRRDVISPGPFSSVVSTSGTSTFGGRVTPTRRQHISSPYHRRKLSEENNQFTPLFGYGVAAPNNTPDSPPPRRYDAVSPNRGQAPNTEFYAITRVEPPLETADYAEESETRRIQERADAQSRTQNERPYFVVARSTNVIDGAANLIEYSTARVMSGGVKIGSILPRGANGVIEEEDEDVADMDSDGEVETTAAETPAAAPAAPITASPPPMGHQMAIPTYPLGIPVPGQPQAMSTAPLIPVSATMGRSSQLVSMAGAAGTPAKTTAPRTISATHPPSSLSTENLHSRPLLALGSHGLHIAPHLSLPSPVTSTSGSQSHVAPVEYCGDFRTTGHCRFSTRCRYSHDIEPRVRTSTSNVASRYRSIAPSASTDRTLSPRTAAVGIPPVPPGYQLSNVLPQPHHLPGVPLSQQSLPPFVFAHPSSVAHPLTSPAATAAANKGVKMANTEKANRILKSLGITPQQLLAHQPAPTIMADGEIMYDLTQGRPNEGVLLEQDSAFPFPTGMGLERGMKEARDMVLMRYGTEQEKRSVMGSSAGMVMDGEEDIWTVTRRRSHLPNELGPSEEPQQRRSGRLAEHEQPGLSQQQHLYAQQQYQQGKGITRPPNQQYQQVEIDARQATQMRIPASCSPVQHLQYPNPKQYQTPSHPYPSHYPAMVQYQHPTQAQVPMAPVTLATAPSPATMSSAPGGSLTQEEVIKVLTALGLSVPGITTTPAHPTPPSVQTTPYSSVQPGPSTVSHPGQNLQRPGYLPGPYDYMHH